MASRPPSARPIDEPSSAGPCLGPILVASWSSPSLPHPAERCSGLFPALDPLPERGPPPLARGTMRLRRAVLLTVVIGATSLLAYASWQRAAHARAAATIVAPR
ncbi:MAG: hypothetical protein KDK70_01155 [Myxococcales bacterium]|nr:hypothetical protein [Myxococcales bacterium]